jgi:type 1 fimbriae regulatory protein FimB/type 1 fimbriae regulatory protein FimE
MSKTAALTNVVELRPTTVLTTKRVRPVVDKREYLTEDEVEKLMKAAPTPRDRAMILAGYTHGMRVSELINLRWNQINFDTGRISVRRLKGSEDGEHVLRGRATRAEGLEADTAHGQPVRVPELPGRAYDPPGVR